VNVSRPLVEGAALRSTTEAQRAEWLRDLGKAVAVHSGRHWYAPNPGFWRPVHLLARLSPDQATKPRPACWGYEAVLDAHSTAVANASVPIHWLPRLESHSEDNLSSNRRYQLRKARRLVEFIEAGAALLLEQGYAIVASSLERTRFERVPTREAYERSVRRDVRPGRRFVLAGLVAGALAGYVDGFAVDGTAYLDNLYVATHALKTQISIGLQFAFVEACRRSGEISELVHGAHALEDESLSLYKERIGFPVHRLPARLWLLPGCRSVLRRLAPTRYYRWTGDPPTSRAA
jgi:hypothetical protein